MTHVQLMRAAICLVKSDPFFRMHVWCIKETWSGYETIASGCIALKYHDLSATMDYHMYNAILMLFFLPVYRSSRDKAEAYTEVTNPTTKTTDVPVSFNEAYALHKITTEEVTYEMVK